MAILVTGGAGYIGSHMTWCLLDAGEDVCVLDNLSTGSRFSVPADGAFVRGNAGDVVLVRRILRRHAIEAVIHFAGSIVVPDSVRDPLEYYRNNTCVSRNLLEACISEGVDKFIFSSTAAIYGTPDTAFVDEQSPARPVSPYGTSKLMTELMLRDAAAACPFRYVALRYFNVAGADPQARTGQSSRRATHLIKVACEAALGLRDRVEIYGTDYPTPDGTGVRDYIHVTDLAEAHLQALEYLRAGGQSSVFNCGYGHGHSVREVLDMVRGVSGEPFRVDESPRRPGDAAHIVASCAKITRELDWRPRHADLQEIVLHALNWERLRFARAPAALPNAGQVASSPRLDKTPANVAERLNA